MTSSIVNDQCFSGKSSSEEKEGILLATSILSPPRITGEPLFGHHGSGLIYPDEQIVYGSSNEHSPSVLQAGAAAGGFPFRPHSADLTSFLSAAVGHHHLLPGGLEIHPNDSDDDDNEISEESDEEEDEQSDGDESSAEELNE